jgi:hypothetical protein
MIQSAVSYKEYETNEKNINLKKSEFAGTLVEIKDYNPAHHSLKVVRVSDGKPLVGNTTRDSNINKSKPFEQPNSISFKTLPAPDAPILEVNDSEASMRGSSGDGFYSSRQFGNIVKGPTSFSALPHEIRVSGLMTLHPLLTSGFPSTIVTPIPTLQWSLPSGAMLGPIAKDVALMATLVGIIG